MIKFLFTGSQSSLEHLETGTLYSTRSVAVMIYYKTGLVAAINWCRRRVLRLLAIAHGAKPLAKHA